MKLSEICLKITDGTHGSIIDDKEGSFYLLSCKNIKNGKIVITNIDRRINYTTFKNLNKRTNLSVNDILITTVGTIGELAIINSHEINYEFQRSVGIIKVDPERIIPKYVFYYLSSNSAKNQINSLIKGAVQKCLFLNDIGRIEIVEKTIFEQQHIVDTIGSIDELIESNNKLLIRIEELINIIFDKNYDYWKIQEKLGRIFVCSLGGTPSTKKIEYWNGDIPWINSGEINNLRISTPTKYITQLGLQKSATKLLPSGTTVIAITGATLGQVSLLEIDSCTNQSVIGILENKQYKKDYIYPLMKKIIQELMLNQTGGAQQHINKNDVQSFVINLPTIEQYNKYTNIVSTLINQQSLIIKQNDKLIKLKEKYLNKFFG